MLFIRGSQWAPLHRPFKTVASLQLFSSPFRAHWLCVRNELKDRQLGKDIFHVRENLFPKPVLHYEWKLFLERGFAVYFSSTRRPAVSTGITSWTGN